MTCGDTYAASLEALEIGTCLVDELRAARADATWRADLLTQADQERQAAFDSWREHLAQSIGVSVQRVGEHATLHYGAILRIVPLSALRTSRGVQVVAEALWDAEHPRPDIEQCSRAWQEARPRAIRDLARDIERAAN